mmetsp:Transcript_61161/g.144465  ORF Transcript_61161/g.144465 Transcript_61161/m.144465 type:complete len:260 (-) Transcript_61161:1456-2235(-)
MISPCSTRRSMALRAVTRDSPNCSASTRSLGSASSAWNTASRMACARAWASCMYSGDAAFGSGLKSKTSLMRTLFPAVESARARRVPRRHAARRDAPAARAGSAPPGAVRCCPPGPPAGSDAPRRPGPPTHARPRPAAGQRPGQRPRARTRAARDRHNRPGRHVRKIRAGPRVSNRLAARRPAPAAPPLCGRRRRHAPASWPAGRARHHCLRRRSASPSHRSCAGCRPAAAPRRPSPCQRSAMRPAHRHAPRAARRARR